MVPMTRRPPTAMLRKEMQMLLAMEAFRPEGREERREKGKNGKY